MLRTIVRRISEQPHTKTNHRSAKSHRKQFAFQKLPQIRKPNFPQALETERKKKQFSHRTSKRAAVRVPMSLASPAVDANTV